MKKNVSIVLIHYNTAKDLEQSLLRLYSQAHNIEIIVIDNHSTERLTIIQKRFKDVIWVENDQNRGFSFAANQGAAIAQGRWLLFLNPDVQISVSELTRLYHYAEQNHYDALSPTFPDERYHKPLPTFISLLREFTPLRRVLPADHGQKTLVGGCLLIKKKTLLSINGWDERFFLWFEDSDLTQRLIHKGFRIGFAPFSFTHQGGSSIKKLGSDRQKDIFFHSLEIYIKKYFSLSQQRLLRQLIVRRFTHRVLYPPLNSNVTWVVPNMNLNLLEDFLTTNADFFNILGDELIIVSSKLNAKNIWKFRNKYPGVRFIQIDHNQGFSYTVNVGFRASTTEWVGTVNDDVILNNSTLSNLKKHTKRAFGSVNPVIYSLNQEIESAGINILSRGKAEPITMLPQRLTTVVPATNAACVLYNAHALNDVGIFDEKFGSYLEDIDLSLRLDKQGYPNIVVKNATMLHAKHQTSKKMGKYKQFLDVKNWWLVIIKNWSFTQFLLNSPFILLERVRNISGLLK